jgi:UDP-3-O-[3-hydroxymyristoyl] glucosamine N-acyltransferase
VQVTVSALAALVQGQVYGPPDRPVHAARTLQEAGPTDVSFLENERGVRHLKGCRAGALLIPTSLADRRAELGPGAEHTFAFIEVADPLGAFITIVRHLHGEPVAPPPGIAPQAIVHPTAQLGPDCTVMANAFIAEGAVLGARCRIYPGVYVGPGCRLGDDVVLYPQAVLYDRTVLGNRVIVHAGAVLGADGFGYRFAGGAHVKVPQFGNVEVGDDVEIGACTTVDRGTFQSTRIGKGTKVDNLVMIAHNCRIGRHNVLASQVGIAGSCTTGDYVVMAGQVGIADHVTINDRAVVGAQSGVPNDVAAGQRVFGYPAREEHEARRIMASLVSLPPLLKRVRQLEQAVEALTGKSPGADVPGAQERKAG